MGYIISDGKAVGIVEERFFELGNSALLGIPTPVWLTAICFVLFGLLLNKTTFGRNTLAMGAMRKRRAWPGSTWCAPRSSSSP